MGITSLDFAKAWVCKMDTQLFLVTLDRYRMLKKNMYEFTIDMLKAFDSIIHLHAIFSLLRSGMIPFLCRLMELI